ncbi:YkvA family protein [Kineococcus gynurae]|uniref:YkvA family protein n=1 Tax=Kineococcus gynurae TaxID=452979 RepID=A0ABV5LV52_9ACTN
MSARALPAAPRAARRRAAFGVLWSTLRAGSAPGAPSLAERAHNAPAMTRDALAGRWTGPGRTRLGLAALGVLYLISPVDVVPEALIPIVGLLDDAVVAAWAAGAALIATEDYARWRAENPAPLDPPAAGPAPGAITRH